MKQLNKAYGNIVVLANVRGQRKIPYLDRDRLFRLRDSRVRKIVQYAARTVPFYREFFRKESIDPREIRTADDLSKLPLISKDLIRKSGHLFISTSGLGRTAVPFRTSGSTGVPLTIFHDRVSLLKNIAFGEREREVIVQACGRALGYKEAEIYYSGGIRRKAREFYRQNTFIPIRPNLLSLSLAAPFEKIVSDINGFCPDVIRSCGSYLETFFRLIAARNIRVHIPRMVIYGADTMSDSGRKFIEERFDIPVFSTYQAAESFKIGFFCLERKGFHLHEDLCHVKIVDQSGKEVRDGQPGEVVISNLVNYGMVILNYRLSDVATLASARCPCGRTFGLLTQLEGRTDDVIFLPGGRFIHSREVWGFFINRREVLRYQLVQRAPSSFLIRISTADKNVYDRIVGDIVAGLSNLLGGSCAIEAECALGLELFPDSKFSPVASQCKHEPLSCFRK